MQQTQVNTQVVGKPTVKLVCKCNCFSTWAVQLQLKEISPWFSFQRNLTMVLFQGNLTMVLISKHTCGCENNKYYTIL